MAVPNTGTRIMCYEASFIGATENAGVENMGVGNAGAENVAPECMLSSSCLSRVKQTVCQTYQFICIIRIQILVCPSKALFLFSQRRI